MGLLIEFVNFFVPTAELHEKSSADMMNSCENFKTILQRERARADRNGHGFSLVTFNTEAYKNEPQFTGKLIQQLAKKIRITDEIGWFDNQNIGVLLFNTPAEGAWNFVQNLQEEKAATPLPVPVPMIYTYPKDWKNLIKNPQDTQALTIEHSTADAPTSEKSQEPSSAQSPSLDATNLQLLFTTPNPAWKRLLDISGATIALTLLSPLFLLIALVVKCTSKGPVFFKQKRAGFNGAPFNCYKFRSMCIDAEDKKRELMQHNERSGPVFKMTNDPRVTTVGTFLRKWSLDELPQFINVLLGDMSLVGPRPPTLDEVEKYERWHNYRLEVKPGITCIWQVYARHEKCFENWVRLDIEYRKKQSFLTDIKLLFLTIPAVLSRRGAC